MRRPPLSVISFGAFMVVSLVFGFSQRGLTLPGALVSIVLLVLVFVAHRFMERGPWI